MRIKKEFCIGILLFFFLVSSVQATKVALIVKDANSLSQIHEKNVRDTLTDLGFDVTLVDKNSNVTYSDYNLIIVAGRPSNVYSYEHLDSFVADVPVNNYPTVAIDSAYPDDWGWVSSGGISTLSTTGLQQIEIIDNTSSITSDYKIGDKVQVHIIEGKTIIDLVGGKHKLTQLASITDNHNNAVIAVAEANTMLYDNKTTKARIVFFGITNPLYWSYEAKTLFKNSISWVLSDIDKDGILDYKDNCPSITNINQKDTDGDGIGNVCDNCPFIYNPSQSDIDKNGIGDACDPDIDGDGILNNIDNCPLKYNPDQKDRNNNGIGDACDILPYQVFLDVDNDSVNETAINENNITEDGFEVYEDPNYNTLAIPIDGDFDGMIDWLIYQEPDETYEKYWDPDNGILTNVNKTDDDYYIDTNGDNTTDVTYNSYYNAFITRRDVDSDSKIELALDLNFDGSYDVYKDLDGSSKLLHIIDGDNDKKNDFILGMDGENITKPAKYWDPDDNILTDILEIDFDGDGKNEYLIDVNGDGKFEKIFNSNTLHDLPDLIVSSISFNPNSPTEGNNVKINVRVENIGEYDATHFTVEFRLDGNFVSSKNISLSAHDSTELEFIWYNAEKGSHTIEIIADSNNTILESNEDNNKKSTSISVSGLPPVSGGGGGTTTYAGDANFTGFPDKVEVDIGDKLKLSGKFKSSLTYGLENVEFSIESEGLNPSWYTISPTKYGRIDQDESKDVSIEFTIPEDAHIYTYSIKLKASADSAVGRKTFQKMFTLMLKERIVIPTTTTTTTTPEETTTTTIPEEKPSPLTGFYAAIKAYSIYIAIIIIIAIIVILLKVFKVKFEFVNNKGQYTYGKGWVTSILKFKSFSTSSLKTLFTKW